MSAHETWTVVIPAFNEEDFLAPTVQSIIDQTVSGARLIFIDNASTDGTLALMEKIAADASAHHVTILHDDRPGKIRALETGIKAIETPLVAMCDADTFYPPDYLARAEKMMTASDQIAAAYAFGVYSAASPFQAWFTKNKGAVMAKLRPAQCHTGGYGQSFKTDALRRAGGYSDKIWPFMVADHEVSNRILKQGVIAYDREHFCLTSSRRSDRGNVDWRLHERLMYNVMSHRQQDWFFYEYLKPRFEARKMFNSNLRARDWENETPSASE